MSLEHSPHLKEASPTKHHELVSTQKKEARNILTEIQNIEHWLKGFALNLTKNQEDAEDLYQEALYKIRKKQDTFNPQTNFKAWAFMIMKNEFINTYRKEQRNPLYNKNDLGDISNYVSSSPDVYTHLLTEAIHKRIDVIPEKYQTTFSLMIEGYEYQEIADKLGIPLSNVKSYIYLVRQKLRKERSSLS